MSTEQKPPQELSDAIERALSKTLTHMSQLYIDSIDKMCKVHGYDVSDIDVILDNVIDQPEDTKIAEKPVQVTEKPVQAVESVNEKVKVTATETNVTATPKTNDEYVDSSLDPISPTSNNRETIEDSIANAHIRPEKLPSKPIPLSPYGLFYNSLISKRKPKQLTAFLKNGVHTLDYVEFMIRKSKRYINIIVNTSRDPETQKFDIDCLNLFIGNLEKLKALGDSTASMATPAKTAIPELIDESVNTVAPAVPDTPPTLDESVNTVAPAVPDTPFDNAIPNAPKAELPDIAQLKVWQRGYPDIDMVFTDTTDHNDMSLQWANWEANGTWTPETLIEHGYMRKTTLEEQYVLGKVKLGEPVNPIEQSKLRVAIHDIKVKLAKATVF